MPTSLFDPAVDLILQAMPTQTQRPDGSLLSYPYPSPADWRDHWIYFLLVDRFNNPVALPNPDEYPCDVYQGGTLAGIRQRLPYLKELGVGALWLSPVLINPQWFTAYWGGYGTLDFLRIEPRFCTDPAAAARLDPSLGDQEFRTLVDDAHALGIYVILDIVLNHTGDVFRYEGGRDEAPWQADRVYKVGWRDATGRPQEEWTDIATVAQVPREGGIWPQELQRNEYFRRQGGNTSLGDFSRMKELATDFSPDGQVYPVRNLLIRAYQYLIARFDLDGYRIDTLQYVETDFARVFGNAMREYALSIGKKNFFTFGEVWQDDDEERISEFIGRNTAKNEEFIGVDAAIDFPVRKRLVAAVKGFAAPAELASHYEKRRDILRTIVSSHGDAGRHYITFLDNHDLEERFHHPHFPEQTALALTCLMTLQGVPCLYYGTEQGLAGRGNKREYVREALWGLQPHFSVESSLYQWIKDLTLLRLSQPALRYGRQYFRPCSGDGVQFGFSPYKGGVLAYSRILNDQEVLVVANTNTERPCTVHVVIDSALHPPGKRWDLIFPFDARGLYPAASATRAGNRTLETALEPMQVLVLKSH